MGQCVFCRNRAVFKTEAGGLCGEHFAVWFERGVEETVLKYRMVSAGDRVCVGFSGGKDSTVLLSVLSRVFPEVELVAVTVDEGIACYRDATIAEARRTVRRLGVEHRVVSFAEVCGLSLDELLAEDARTACSVCGTLRRRALNCAAREVGADSIATGHCLDDEAQSVVMNYVRGDFTRITGQFNSNSAEWFVPRIKPLCRSTERAVVAYGIAEGILARLPECPYTRYALRKDVRTWLGWVEHEWPGTLMKIVEGQERLQERLPPMDVPEVRLHPCEVCGEPTGNRVCAACVKLERILGRGR